MSIKRRGFVKGLLAAPIIAPVVPAIGQTQPAAQAASPAAQPVVRPPTSEKLAVVDEDLTAETTQRFFKPDEFAALKRLGDLLVPPMQGKPGASEAGAALFLDFLIGQSPADRQHLYNRGLDHLNSASRKQFNKFFADLDDAQATSIVKPLMTVRLWPQDVPADPLQQFILQAHQDLRTATANSREWAAAASTGSGGRRGFNRAAGLYWNPIDPVAKG